MPTSSTAPQTATSWPNWLPAAALASLVYIGFQPFTDVASATGGNIANQIGFALIGVAALRMVYGLPEHARAALLQPAWLAFAFGLAFAVTQADDVNGAVRAALFSAIVVLAGGAAVAWLASKADLTGWLTFVALATLGFCLTAVYLFPAIGVHGAGGYEAQHAGLWRGIYPHKNVAGYVAGAFVVTGLYVARNGRPFWGLLTVALALLFTLEAGSKTVLGVLPAAVAAGWLASRFENGLLRAFVVVAPVLTLAIVTLGAAISEQANELLQTISPNTTFTGRLDLWKFTVEQIVKQPFAGYGYESFWGTPRVTLLEQPIELSWDVRKIVHGHNSYLDTLINFGAIGAVPVLWVLLVRPVFHFASLPRIGRGAAAPLGELYISLWLLCAMGASLETFFVRRSDPVWFTLVIAVFGLQIAYARTRPQLAANSAGSSRSTTAVAAE